MNNENNEQATPPAIEPKQKKSGIWATCAGKIAALWKSGTKGKAICIVSVLVVLGIIGAFTDDEEGGGSSGSGSRGGGKKFEVNAPVKSLCGFSIGATPDSVKHLLKKPDVDDLPSMYLTRVEGELATKYRYFDWAVLSFTPNPMTGTGRYLTKVTLHVKNESEMRNWHEKDYDEERSNIEAQLEKKYGITFHEKLGQRCWYSEENDDIPLQYISIGRSYGDSPILTFESSLFSSNAIKAYQEKQRQSSKISADAGGDQL